MWLVWCYTYWILWQTGCVINARWVLLDYKLTFALLVIKFWHTFMKFIIRVINKSNVVVGASLRLNLFHANVPFLYPLKTSENQGFSEVFRGYGNGTLAWNGLKNRIFQLQKDLSRVSVRNFRVNLYQKTVTNQRVTVNQYALWHLRWMVLGFHAIEIMVSTKKMTCLHKSPINYKAITQKLLFCFSHLNQWNYTVV